MNGEGIGPSGYRGEQNTPADSGALAKNDERAKTPEIAMREIEARERALVSEAEDIRIHLDKSVKGTSLIETVIESKKHPGNTEKYVYPYQSIIAHRLKDSFGDKENLDLLHKGYRDIRTTELKEEIADLESGAEEKRLRDHYAELDAIHDRVVDSPEGHYKGYTSRSIESAKHKTLEAIKSIPRTVVRKREELETIPDLLAIIEKAITSS